MHEFGLIGITSVTDRILSLAPWLALVLVFLLPALEASAFLGFIFPGEIAVILGGVVASQGRAPLWAFILAAVSGAIVGDSIGYFIGRRWGTALLQGTVGRLRIVRRYLDRHLETAEAYVRRRKGSAVFFGRFTVALRVLVPGLAGISRVHYPSFLLYNVAGGTAWGTGFTILGYLAGAGYHQVEKVAGQIGLLLLALIVVGLLLSYLIRRLHEHSARVAAFGNRLAATPAVVWVRTRFPEQVRWARNRLDPTTPQGFWLTFTVAVGVLAGWAFGALTQDVVAHDEMALFDPQFETWVVTHRIAWLTSGLEIVTWLGSLLVIVPLLVAVAVALIARRRDWRRVALLVIAVAGAVALYDLVKPVVGRARPPATLWIGNYDGPAFPSGHATQTVAFYAMLAIVLLTGRSFRARALLWVGAALVTILVGASRVYLGAHWLTDVLAGYALGAAWVALVVSIRLLTTRRAGRGGRGCGIGPARARAASAARPGRR
jgi:membrane protein DedA with SNARE-associated domain/membrane-associated phospholipid phosphatase